MPSNFNSTTPAAPAGFTNVVFQTDGNGNDSAYVPASSGGTGGSSGDIQFNDGAGDFGGSAATINTAGSITIPEGQVIEWSGGYGPYSTAAISALASDTLAIGDGSPGDVSGAAAMTALILFGSSSYYDYNLFHTTIYSGAEQNWSLILPPNPGTSGQVLTTNGSGVTYWETPSGGGGGGGSVTSFSSGNLSPLFTTSVATPTTTPVLSFSLNTQNANTVFAGPTSGGAAAPTFRALVAADLPAGAVTSSALTPGVIPQATGASSIGNTSPQLDNGLTTAQTLTYVGTSGMVINTTGSPAFLTPVNTSLLTIQSGASNRIVAESYGGSGYHTAVAFGGTAASPTAVTSGTEIGGFNAFAYNGAALNGPIASFRIYANQTQGVGAGGTYVDITTTPNGSTTQAEVVRFNSDGGITVPSTVTGGDKGAGTINAGGLYVNGVAVSTAAPGGSTGDIQYNNGGVFGGSLTTITAAGSITIPDTQVIQWTGSAYSSVGLSQLAADTLAVGNGTASDVSGGMAMTALILYGSSYYSAYDAYQTTILSGALQDWSLVLPETAGTAGQVLTNIGSGFTAWESLTTIGVPWSALTNPTTNLSLIMGTDTTTFNYATGLASAWTWQNNTPTVTGASTTVALSTSTAPTHSGGISWTYTLAATESGAGSNAWVGASVTTSGWTGGATGNNGTFIITASTTTTVTVQNATGTTINTGTPVMISSAVSSSPVLQIAGTVNTGTAGTLNSAADVWSIQNVIGSVVPNPTSTLTFTHSGSSGAASVSVPSLTCGAFNTAGTNITFANAGTIFFEFHSGATFSGGSATIIGFSSNVTPTAATPDTAISRVSAGILGIGTGAQGSIAGSIQCSSIALNGAVASPTAGVYYSGGTAGVTQTAEAVGTLATTGGIVTTFTAVSDERLKVAYAYKGGLDEVLAITPIRYRWNETGAKYSGQSIERDFIGFSAQNVRKVIPEAVWVSKDDYLGLDDRPVIAALVNAVKELTERIAVLEGKEKPWHNPARPQVQ